MKEIIESYGDIVLELTGFSLMLAILLAVWKAGFFADAVTNIINGMI